MKLFSCDDCGLIYDLDKIDIPESSDYDQDNPEDWVWNGDGFSPVLKCVCGGKTPIEKGA